jgi:hypothetical protein
MAYGTVVADVVQSSITGVSLGAGNATLLKNRLIDSGFIINQRGYVSGTALSAGTYAHDRWKAGASGCTYTFTQGSAGVPIVITITAGSLQQVIEGCNMPDGGTFTLSWTGTAQGRVNGGGYSTSPLIVTGLTAGANCTVEFNTGTCSFPQLEVGSSATGFEYRQYQQELALCQRYYWKVVPDGGSICGFGSGQFANSTTVNIIFSYPVSMRTAPTMAYGGTYNINGAGSAYAVSAITGYTSSTYGRADFTVSGATAGQGAAGWLPNASTNFITASAEL